MRGFRQMPNLDVDVVLGSGNEVEVGLVNGVLSARHAPRPEAAGAQNLAPSLS